MRSVVKMQFSLMVRKKGFQFAFTIMMIYAMASYAVAVWGYKNWDIQSMYSAYTYCINSDAAPFFTYFRQLFPFLIVFPFTFSSMTDRVNKITTYVFPRCRQKDYYRSLYITAFSGGFILMFIPIFLNWCLYLFTIPQDGGFVFGVPFSRSFMNMATDKSIFPFPALFLKSTMGYAFVYNLIISAFAGLLSVFSLACSFFIKKYKIFALLPVYIVFYIGKMVDIASLNGNQAYIGYDPFDYVTITSLNGKRLWIIVLFCLVITLFSAIQLWRMERKETI